MKKTFILITSLILLFLFTSCLTPSNNVYKVTYYIDEEVYYETEIKENEKVENIKVPEIEYYELKNWLNKETNEPYDFSLPLKGDLELVANYSKITNLAGGEEGKYYDFSNLTDEQLFEIANKLEDFLIEHAFSIPIYKNLSLKCNLLSNRIMYPVDKNLKGYELYSDFTGENVFRYAVEKINNSFINNNIINHNLIFKGLYSYEYSEDLLSKKLVPYFAKEDPICVDNDGYRWKVYIDEGFKFSDGTDVKFEDFVNAYELNLKNEDAIIYNMRNIINASKYNKSECSREDVGIEYNYEEKSIIFTFGIPKSKNTVKDLLEDSTFSPIPFFELVENEDYSKFKFVGEYVLKSFENNVITYEKNPYYINKNGVLRTFEKIEYYYVDDKNVGYNMFMEELVDCIEVSKEYFDKYYELGHNMVEVYGTTYGLHLNLNESVGNQNPIILNQDFRKALYYGINRELFNGIFKPADKEINPGSILKDYYRVLYPYQQEEAVYDAKLSLDYYINALDDLIMDNEISNDNQNIIEIEVICFENKEKYEEILNSYESLFNSQTKYSNIKIDFILNNLTAYEVQEKLRNADYDIAAMPLSSTPEAISILLIWVNQSSTYLAPMHRNSMVYTAIKSNLIEFQNELYTYETLVTILLNEYKSVFIKNGKIVWPY